MKDSGNTTEIEATRKALR